MEKELIEAADFKGLVKHVAYQLTPNGIDSSVKSAGYITNAVGMIYTTDDGPFSAKGFFILDQDLDQETMTVEYIVSMDIKEPQWEKYKSLIVDPIIKRFWEEAFDLIEESDVMAEDALAKMQAASQTLQ